MKDDKTVRRSATAAVGLWVIAFLISHATWIIGWHAPDGTWSVARMHAECASPLGQFAQSVYGETSRCSSANAWYDICGFLVLLGIVAAGVCVHRIYRLKKFNIVSRTP